MHLQKKPCSPMAAVRARSDGQDWVKWNRGFGVLLFGQVRKHLAFDRNYELKRLGVQSQSSRGLSERSDH